MLNRLLYDRGIIGVIVMKIIDLEQYTYYVRPGFTDMRKCAGSLAFIVQNQMGKRPEEKTVFVFCGRNRKTVKAILWDRNGWLEITKRLACVGSFKWPVNEEEAMEVTATQIAGLLAGNDVWRHFDVFVPANGS